MKDIKKEHLTINQRIKYLRKEILMISQGEFGNKLGITKASISRIEIGTTTLTERNIKSICREFNVSYEWLKEGLGNILIDVQKTIETEFPIRTFTKLEDQQRIILKLLRCMDDETRNHFFNHIYGYGCGIVYHSNNINIDIIRCEDNDINSLIKSSNITDDDYAIIERYISLSTGERSIINKFLIGFKNEKSED